MANPDDVIYKLPDGEVLCHDGVRYVGPADIPMRCIDRTKLLDKRRPDSEPDLDKCFPDCDAIGGANPWRAYRNLVTLAPGETRDLQVPSIDGCAPPCRVFFNWCGDCFLADFDKAATVDEVLDGTGPEINPRWVWIGADPNSDNGAVQTISLHNPGTAPVMVSLQFND